MISAGTARARGGGAVCLRASASLESSVSHAPLRTGGQGQLSLELPRLTSVAATDADAARSRTPGDRRGAIPPGGPVAKAPRAAPPQLHEQQRLSLEARWAYRGFLEFPIARQALLVVVPEYDRIAPPFAKPVRAGLQGLADGSLLQNFALAAALARLTLAPVDYAAAALAAGDEEGRERLRAALETWPAGLRRRVHARFRALAAEKAGARARGTEP